MTFRGDTGGPLKKVWLFFGLILLCCTIPSPSSAEKLSDLVGQVKGKELKCVVCSSVDGECENLSEDMVKECHTIGGGNSYLETVYGSLALNDTEKDLMMWPPSLTELAKGATQPPPKSGNSSANGNGTGGSESGWTYSSFPGAYQEKAPTAAKEKLTVSGIGMAQKDDKARFTKGFQSCRVMKIWTDSQKNDGKTQEIPSSKPRIVRTCSFVGKEQGGDNFYEGCRTINFKTATVSVCYCTGAGVVMGKDGNNPLPCNRSSRLQVSTIAAFLAASLLTLAGTF